MPITYKMPQFGTSQVASEKIGGRHKYDRSDANSETSLGAELYNVMVQCSSEIDRLEMNESEKSQVRGTGQRYCAGCLTSVNPPKEVGAYAGADLDLSRIRQASKLPFVPPSLHDARPWSSRPLSLQTRSMITSRTQSLTMDDTQPPSPSSTKPRIPYACEACRAAKVKCTPSNTPDICRR